MRAFDNIEHTLRNAFNRGRIPADRNVLQHFCLVIQQVSLLHCTYQQSNLIWRRRKTHEQVLDMLKGLNRENACEDHFACRCIDQSLFLSDLQLISCIKQIAPRSTICKKPALLLLYELA